MRRRTTLAGRRVLVTGAARGIGAALARRLHEKGAQVALLGLEPAALAAVAHDCAAPWQECDVRNRTAVTEAVDGLAEKLGGLDIVVANAGIAKQWSVLHGDPAVLETTLQVNTLGVCHTIQAAARHVAHPNGYILTVSSLAAAVHLPLLGAYSASKAAVEALGDTTRLELGPTGAKAGVAYFAELATDMTTRGFDTKAAAAFFGTRGTLSRVTPLDVAIDALERGIRRRAARICSPRWAAPVLLARMPVQRAIALRARGPRMREALAIAVKEDVPFTTEQPE
ncbi:SDR family NAD(P)-dependent oxidoreductase [Actinophytocola algeriensis]|uniref:NAD(P)-dependent dehydrogenase (Short-subunit alcohol dehydrogenase family) n=1 Tax=Actinophytocola algeriensis TaxID=1768010 RepID=A0A7W7VD51_9PSEU|nr:SDR family NAD(P)-dependent oxidoreductase [Actinophytocola algeriensis]MBB4905806.1 NAD(P)-dependent dehydrogenase (short-subunit alcohol dehydrogenase family) [Actinophytocola algeriensis]MBE1472509.1 NAD(P)-dependent dehydrogenase (short-subunit alcohol dehydrogenase family) [Actinophytocola algeriensis]